MLHGLKDPCRERRKIKTIISPEKKIKNQFPPDEDIGRIVPLPGRKEVLVKPKGKTRKIKWPRDADISRVVPPPAY